MPGRATKPLLGDAANRAHRQRVALPTPVHSRVAVLVPTILIAVLALAFAPPAAGFVYWANGGGTIGRANLDGAAANQSFIAGASNPCGVAVDDAHVYWADVGDNGPIERADLDGTGRKSLIDDASFPCGVAVDASHIYWANVDGTIGRADLDGGHPSKDFIATGGLLCGLAVDPGHLYWADSDGTIGRANLDGSGVNDSFISGASRPCGVALDSAHLYWSNDAASGSIGRANLDGSAVNQSFVAGAHFPCGVAVDAGHIYWANDLATGSVGRANLDGAAANQSFITGASFPCGVAVDALPAAPSPPAQPPSNEFTFGRPKLNVRKGTASLPVTVPGPGELALSGSGVMASRISTASTGPRVVLVSIKAKGQKQRTLQRTGRVKIKATVSYTPTGGRPRTRSANLKLSER